MIRLKSHQLIRVFLLLLIPTVLSGQRSISGRITYAEDGEPIPAATVFIANTTVGAVADAEGYYSLKISGEGSYRLTVSHVGYQPVFLDIKPGKESIVFDIALILNELDEVAVIQKVRARQKDVTLFWKTLLGKSPSKKTIYALNPEAVFYYYNSETQQLTVTCREPLQIINNETGYQLQVVIGHFTHNYNTELSSWKAEFNFTELEPENVRQKDLWETNRKNIYKVSIPNFIKSLYHNTLMENGYLLAFPQKTDVKGNEYATYEKPDSFLTVDSIKNAKIFRIPSVLKNLILVCYGKPITQSMLEDVYQAQIVRPQVSVMNIMNKVSRAKNASDYWEEIGLFRNVIETPTVSVHIFPDGTTDNPVKLSPCFSSNSLTGLNMRLPSDYEPDVSPAMMQPVNAGVMVENLTDNVHNWFNTQLEVYPQEKIHLHTDRHVYASGEKILFKAYVTDALTLVSSLNSRYVYVELISPSDSLIKRVMVRPVDGIFYGNLPLVDFVPTGNYTLRAYTRYMENLGDDYFFKKNIRIENTATANRSPARREILSDDFEVSFFPEGGNLPEGVLCSVAFKALNSNGYPETITGVLVDETGEAILRDVSNSSCSNDKVGGEAILRDADVPSAFTSGTTFIQSFHAGMGVFEYIPEVGKKVYLRCKNNNGLEKQFELPQPNPQACSLTASLSVDSILIGIKSSSQTPDVPYYLLVHCRGEVLYFSEWDNGEENVSGRYGRVPGLESGRDGRVPGMLFTRDEFPAGIIQFVLFDEQMNALSERLVFNKNYDEAKVAFNTDKSSYKKREKVMVTLNLLGGIGEKLPLPSHLSVAITDDKDVAVDSSTTILSSLLLSSELKGYIENPAWYLQDTDESAKALDYLMLTHGWRRYNIPDVAKGKFAYPQIPFQMNREISGKVKNSMLSKNVTGSEISILSIDGNYGITTADKQGGFKFQDVDIPDSVSFFIQALNKKGKNRFELVINEESFPELIYATQSPIAKMSVISKETKSEDEANAFITKAEQRSKYDDDMRVIHLREVEVTAKRIDNKTDPRIQNKWGTEGSDFTIHRENFAKTNPGSVPNLLFRNVIPREEIFETPFGGLYIRFDHSSYPPLVLVDGVPASLDVLRNFPVNYVESIDLFRTNSAARFGVQGMNGGAISITTRKWGSINRESDDFNYTVYTPLGYQKPVEFYSPNYETLDAKYLSIPDYRTTLFWKPDITLSDTGEAGFEFYTSDFPTTYSVVIEGLTSDGRIVRQVEKIGVE